MTHPDVSGRRNQLEESPRDLTAWVELAAGLGSGSVVLAGHSAGAQRVVL